MTPIIGGIHHVTAITSDAQKNVDFYTGVLGMKLIKVTVNYDDPSAYHLYYGDKLGRPGTALTFFAWPGAYRGRIGAPQVTATAFAVPEGSLDFWSTRLAESGVTGISRETRFGEDLLSFTDPDGMILELVATKSLGEHKDDHYGTLDSAHFIRGFHSVTLAERDLGETAELLSNVMGLERIQNGSERHRFHTVAGNFASIVDVVLSGASPAGTMGAGTVHHVAFRTPNDEHELAWREKLRSSGHGVSKVMDRQYFHSIYFREPGGVLFEIATDEPGFTVDESPEKLGSDLRLPSWMEEHREKIKQALPELRLPISS